MVKSSLLWIRENISIGELASSPNSFLKVIASLFSSIFSFKFYSPSSKLSIKRRLSAILFIVILCAPFFSEKLVANALLDSASNIQMIGLLLFTKYLVPFELAAIMLLVAMISGIVLASKRMDENLEQAKIDEALESAKEAR